jgi:hypothetical protein
MSLRTNISGKHLIRLTVVGLFCLGFGLYSLYDGMVAWPNQREKGLAYEKLKEEHRENDWPLVVAEHGWEPYDQGEPAQVYQELKEEGRLDEWSQIVAERGWLPNDPGVPRTEFEIAGQFFMLAIAGSAGLLVLIHVLRCRGRWIEMDETGLRTSRGQTVAFDQITAINKKKWDKKGIAKIQYQQNGHDSVLTLDDFIYERPTTDDMLRQVEDHVGHDKIINGKPEPPPKAEAAPAEPSASANNSQS